MQSRAPLIADAVVGRARQRRPAGLALALLCTTLSCLRPAQAQVPRDEAKLHFQRGIELVDEKRFEDASIEFEAAYALSPRAAVLYNVGMAYAAARRPAAALRAFQTYLEQGGESIDRQRAAHVRTQLESLRKQVGTIELRAQPRPSEVRIDGVAVEGSDAVLVDPGTHVVLASAPGRLEASQSVVVRSGELVIVELTLAAPIQAPPSPAIVATPAVPSCAPVREASVAKGRADYDQERAARSRRTWLAASTALAGVTLAGVTTALVIANNARYASWKEQQATLDEQWGSPPLPSDLSEQQAANDDLARSIKIQDEVSVGLAVASGACLIVAAAVWFGNGMHGEPRAAFTPRPRGAHLRVTW